METPRSRHAARLRAHRRRAQARARWLALGVVVGVLLVVTFAVTAFSGDGSPGAPTTSVPTSSPITTSRPEPLILATIGNLRIQSPVAQDGVTTVGFHGGSGNGALILQPVGPQANEGLLARVWHRITGSAHRGLPWYQLESGSLRTLDVGAVPGTDVYAPVDGTVVAIRNHIVSGRRFGAEIELRPSAAPSLVVEIQHVEQDPALSVGENIAAGSSKLGTVVDITKAERQSLARYSGDSGSNVAIQVYPSATLGVP
jgi:hypothetical protein